MDKDKADRRIERQFLMLEGKLPGFGRRAIEWLRQPRQRLVRVPVGVLLILGGIFSILPFLGIWMLPLGLMLLAIDVPLLKGPVASALVWVERRWAALKRWWSSRGR